MATIDQLQQLYGTKSPEDAILRASKEFGISPTEIASEVGYKVGGQWGNRLGASIDSYQANLWGVGEALGSDWAGRRRQENEAAAELQRGFAREQGAISSYKDVGGIGDAFNYVGGLAVDSLPYLGEAVLGGGVGGLAARGLALGARGANAARTMGGVAASYPSAVGDVLSSQREENGTMDLGSAAALGVPYAALNAFGLEGAAARVKPFRIGTDLLDGMQGVRGGLARAGVTGLTTGFKEGLSETGQEFVNQIGRNAVNPNAGYFGPEALDRYGESFVGGAALGGVTGASLGGWRRSEGYQPPVEQPKPVVPQDSGTSMDLLTPADMPSMMGGIQRGFDPYTPTGYTPAGPRPGSVVLQMPSDPALGDTTPDWSLGQGVFSGERRDLRNVDASRPTDPGFAAGVPGTDFGYDFDASAVRNPNILQNRLGVPDAGGMQGMPSIDMPPLVADQFGAVAGGPFIDDMASGARWRNRPGDSGLVVQRGDPAQQAQALHAVTGGDLGLALSRGVPYDQLGPNPGVTRETYDARLAEIAEARGGNWLTTGAQLAQAGNPAPAPQPPTPEQQQAQAQEERHKAAAAKHQANRDAAVAALYGQDFQGKPPLTPREHETHTTLAGLRDSGAITPEQYDDTVGKLRVALQNGTDKSPNGDNKALNAISKEVKALKEQADAAGAGGNGGAGPTDVGRGTGGQRAPGQPGDVRPAGPGAAAQAVPGSMPADVGAVRGGSDAALTEPATPVTAPVIGTKAPDAVARVEQVVGRALNPKEQKIAQRLASMGPRNQSILRDLLGLDEEGHQSREPLSYEETAAKYVNEAGPNKGKPMDRQGLQAMLKKVGIDVKALDALRGTMDLPTVSTEELGIASTDRAEGAAAQATGYRVTDQVSGGADDFVLDARTVRDQKETDRELAAASPEAAATADADIQARKAVTDSEFDAKRAAAAQVTAALDESLAVPPSGNPEAALEARRPRKTVYDHFARPLREGNMQPVDIEDAAAENDAMAANDPDGILWSDMHPDDQAALVGAWMSYQTELLADKPKQPAEQRFARAWMETQDAADKRRQAPNKPGTYGGAERLAQAGTAPAGVQESAGRPGAQAPQPAADTAGPGTQDVGTWGDQATQLSRNTQRGGGSGTHTAQSLTTALKSFMKAGNLDRVTIVESAEDLRDAWAGNDPRFADADFIASIDEDAVAWARNGQAYLIADRIPVGQEKGVFLHEVGGHLGLERMLGEAEFKRLVGQIKRWAKIGTGVETAVAKAATERADQAGTKNQAAYDAELLAYFIEEAVNAGIDPTQTSYNTPLKRFMQSVFSAFNRVLRQLGIDTGKLTAQDVVDMAYGAAQMRVRGIEGAAGDQAFARWFGNSKIVDEDGRPATWYHGTARDIRKFTPKQADAIFLSPEPPFADLFATLSKRWMDKNAKGQSYGENIMPVYVRAEKPFDYENPGHMRQVLSRLTWGDIDVKTRKEKKNNRLMTLAEDFTNNTGADPSTDEWAFKDFLAYVADAAQDPQRGWEVVEEPAVQKVIRQLGFDSFYVVEMGVKNLGVYSSTQVKSATGNRGTYDRNNPDISKSRRATTGLTDTFKKWFGDSKVVDGNGDPLVVYTGSSNPNIEVFRSSADMNPGNPNGQAGVYFTTDHGLASVYGKKGAVYPVHLRIENPLDLTETFAPSGWKGALAKMLMPKMYAAAKAEQGLRESIAQSLITPSDRNRLVQAGYDGIRGVGGVWVTFHPNQVKAASNKNPTADERIQFSKATSTSQLEAARAEIRARMPAPAQDAMTTIGDAVYKYAPYLMSNFQLMEQFGTRIAGLAKHIKLTDLMTREATRQQMAYDAVGKRWEQLRNKSRLAFDDLNKLMTEASRLAIHPDHEFGEKEWNDHLPPERKADHARLAAEYKRLERTYPEAIAIYHDALKVQNDSWEAQKKALEDLYDKYEVKRPELKKVPGPYFPLMRHGDYLVVAKSQEMLDLEESIKGVDDPTIRKEADKILAEMSQDPKHYWMSAHESRASQERELARQQATGNFASVTAPLASQRLEHLPANVHNTVVRLTSTMSKQFDKGTVDQIQKAVAEMLLQTMPEGHALERQAKRRGVSGSHPDMLRSFVSAGRSNAFYTARTMFAKDIAVNMGEMKDKVKGNVDMTHIVREVEKRVALDMQFTDTPVQNAISSFSWIYHLGASPAFLAMNALQPALVSFPVLAGRFGAAAAVKELGVAWREALAVMKAARFKDGKWDPWSGISEASIKSRYPAVNDKGEQIGEERKAIRELMLRGIVDEGLVHDLGRLADGRYGRLEQATRITGWASQQIELMNRVSTALAAFRLARAEHAKNGMDPKDAYEMAVEEAYRATVKTQIDYSAEGAPRVMRTGGGVPLAKLVFQFRRYQQGMFYLLAANARSALKGDKQAMATLGYLGMVTGAVGGAIGLPFMNAALFAVDQMLDDDDEEGDAETRLRNLMVDITGDREFATVLSKGLPALLGMDLSKRIGLGDVATLIRMDDVEKAKTERDKLAQLLLALGGPSAGAFARVWEGANLMAEGDLLRGIERVLPKMAGDPVQGYRLATQGMTDRKGEQILGPDELGAWDKTVKALGIQPVDMANIYEADAAKKKVQTAIEARKTRIHKEFRFALRDGDMADVRDMINEFNADHPEHAIKPKDELAWRKDARKQESLRGPDGIKFNPRRDQPYEELQRFARG